jgi:uncharacterized protein (TIGR01777 family)
MTIALTGATGFVGQAILRLAAQRGHEVIAFSRTPDRAVHGALETRRFTLDAVPDLHGCEAVIHLAGEPIPGLWTKARKRRILESRVRGTRRIAEGIAALDEKPEVLVNASAIGCYAPAGDDELTENAPGGETFLAATVRAWEEEAIATTTTRVVLLRTGIVLGKNGGALKAMLPCFRFGFGATLGDGSQWMSWIHLEDLARLALFAVEDLDVRGPINAVASWPVRQRDFAHTLARLLHRPAFFRIPAWTLRAVLRGLAGELLDSKRVVPAAALAHGFGFKFPELEPALRDLLA